jgi:N-formylglutamate amidohydrolase
MSRPFFENHVGDGPLVAAALHAGHDLRSEVAAIMAISEAERLREQDPHTCAWTAVAPTRLVGHRSRFEVDLNRPRDKAVYRHPDDAWGLNIWNGEPPDEIIERSLALYDGFYAHVRHLFDRIARRHGRFFVFDLHSYNHRRDGPDAPPADPAANPDVNIGTGSVADRHRWAPLIERFMEELSAFDFHGRRLDVRENVRFRGGAFSRFVHDRFPEQGLSLAIEFKKFFMDEWTGTPDPTACDAILAALESTVSGILEELDRL